MTLPPNPLRVGLEHDRVPDPCIVVIFGASGDLTSRKLVPALYALALEQRLPVGFTVLGVGRRPFPEDRFRQEMQEAVAAHGRTGAPEPAAWAAFAEGLFYEPLDVQNPEAYGALAARLDALVRARGTRGERALLPGDAAVGVPAHRRGLGLAGLASAGAGEPAVWRRLVLEKPIGHDLESARALNRVVAEWFAESQVYRIDHYLGKETVQNLLVFRFANEIFEPIWNRAHVDHVQITVAESLGVEGRGAYYEESGALRDMVQNHLLQLLCLVAMEPPATFAADHVRDERTKVLQAVHPIRADDADQVAVRAQYERGTILGEPVPRLPRRAGRGAPARPPRRTPPCGSALDNWRWAGVPFYLRSGKRLARRLTEIAIQFRRPPQLLFGADAEALPPNHLVLRIQPDEGIAVRFAAKLPVQEFQLRPVTMDFRYGTSFGVTAPEAYERLLLDAMRGDATLFARVDWVEAAWSLLAPIQAAWAAGAAKLATYEAGSAGPPEADRLLEREGRRWRRLLSEGAPDVLHDLAAVEAALGRLWQAQATPDGPESAPPVMRAASFNLVVVAPSEAEGQAAANVLAAVGAEHPGRVLIVCAESEAAAAPLEAWVAMHCRAIGGGAQVCGEHVVIVKRGEPERLAGLVTPLLLPDCPVIAWWRGGPGPAAQILDRLALDALLLDGARFEPGELRRWVARFGGDGRMPLGDLAWERTADWRRWTADAFEPAELREACRRIRSVAVACGGDTTMDALLYVGWLASRLDWRQGPGGRPEVTITPGSDGSEGSGR